MRITSTIKALATFATTVYRLRKDLDYVLNELDDMNSAIIAIEEDLALLPDVLKTLSENQNDIATKMISIETILVDKEIIKGDYSKRILN